MFRRIRWIPVVCLLVPGLAWSHGTVGKRQFLEPIFAEDANPKNEFVMGKFRHEDLREGGNVFHYDFVLEKKLAERFSVALEGGWTKVRGAGPEAGDGSGFENLGVLFKASLFESEAHEWRLSVANEIELPTGGDEVAEDHVALEPMILWAKGFGDLPATRLGMALRPFFIMGDAGLEVVIDDHEDEDGWFTDVLVGYSLPYVHQWSPHRLPQPFAGLVPAVEFTFEGRLQGTGRTTEAYVAPILFWVGKYFEIGFGGRFRLNDHGEAEDGTLVGIFDLFLDDVVPGADALLF